MGKFDSWKDQLADSMKNLSDLDSMAKKDAYVQSSEFKVSGGNKKQTLSDVVENRSVQEQTGKEQTEKKQIEEQQTGKQQTEKPQTGDQENKEEGWDAEDHSPKNVEMTSRVPSEIKISSENEASLFNQSRTKQESADMIHSIEGKTKSPELTETFQNIQKEEKAWSLLDTEIRSPIPKLKENQTQEGQDLFQKGKPDPLKLVNKDNSGNDKKGKIEQNEFTPLSIVEQLMTGKEVELSYKKKSQLSYDNFEDHVDKFPKNDKTISDSFGYDSDNSDDSDLENDFILKFMKKDNQHNEQMKKISLRPVTGSLNDAINHPNQEQKKSRWLNVFEEGNENEFSQEINSVNGELADEENTGERFPSSQRETQYTFGWLKDIAPPQLQSVSKSIASKWKEQKIAEKLRAKMSLDTIRPQQTSDKATDQLDEVQMLKMKENEYVKMDSRSVLAQDEQAEWERIKAMSSSSPFQRTFDVLQKYEDYSFIALTLVTMILVYFYFSHESGKDFET